MSEPLNALFFAFKKRERSGVLLRAALAYVIVLVAIMALFAVAFWAPISNFAAWYGQVVTTMSTTTDPTAIQAVPPPPGMALIMPIALLYMFVIFVLLAAWEAACLRWMLRGEVAGFWGLSLGPDTWRIYSTYWVWFGVNIGIYFALAIVIAILSAVLSAMFGQSASFAPFLLFLAALAAWLFLAVRLAPAAATSIARRKFSFFRAWSVTRARFWPLFGAFLTIVLIYIAAAFVLGVLWFILIYLPMMAQVASVTAGNDPQAAMQAYQEAMASMFVTPIGIAKYVLMQAVGMAMSLAFYIAFFGINARAVEAAIAAGDIEVPSHEAEGT